MPFGHIQWLASEVRVASASLELHSPESRSLTLFVQRRLVLTILSARDNVATAWPFFWPGEPCASRPFLYPIGLLGNSHVS